MQTKKITIIFTIFVASFAIMFCGLMFEKTSKVVFGIGDIVSMSANYEELVIAGGTLDLSKLHIEATDADEQTENLDPTQDVEYHYVRNDGTTEFIIDGDFGNYNLGYPGKYKFLIKLKSNTEITAEFWVTVANKYTISFDANGGTGEMDDAIFFSNEGAYTLPDNEFNAPEGKLFNGWAVGSTSGIRKNASDQVSITQNTTVYAMWKDIPHQTEFSVEFEANGGTGEMATEENVMSEFVLPQCTFKAPAGQIFYGYKLEGSDDLLGVGSIILVTENTKVYAEWKDDCVEVQYAFDEPNKQIAGKILEAKNNQKPLRVYVGNYFVEFDVDAVNSFTETDNAAILFEVLEENLNTKISGAQKIINISLSGTSFSEGEVKVSVPLTTQPARRQVAKVFYIDEDGYVVPLQTIEEDGYIIFITEHFSEFVLAYQRGPLIMLSPWVVVLITFGALIVVGISGFAIYWFGIKKNTFRDLKYIFKRR